MNSAPFLIVRSSRTIDEADNLIAALRQAGLHPLDAIVASQQSCAGLDTSFPILVPEAEAKAARQLLHQWDMERTHLHLV